AAAGGSAGASSRACPTFSVDGSSLTQAVNTSGSAGAVVKAAAMRTGGPANWGPAGANLIVGGVFFDAGSSNGSSTQSFCVCSVIVLVWPLATSVHVSFFVPKSLGTLIENTPHWRLGRKCVG